MSAPTFTIVETMAATFGVFSDGRVCRLNFDPNADRVTFVPVGHADHAAMWPEARTRATDFADALTIVPPRAD